MPDDAHIYTTCDHPLGVRMPHAKFGQDPLKYVDMHKEQKNMTHRHTNLTLYRILSTNLKVISRRLAITFNNS